MKEKIGIFWVIEETVYAFLEEVGKGENAYVAETGIVDSAYAHFCIWEKELSAKYPCADFATFPRGRVVYDTRKHAFILYVDECITNGEIKKICSVFNLKNPQIAYDEHYTCDQCIGDKELF